MDREIVHGRRLVGRKTNDLLMIGSKNNVSLRSILTNQNKNTECNERTIIISFVQLLKFLLWKNIRSIKSCCGKTNQSNDWSQRSTTNPYQSLGFSTPPTSRRQHLSGFASLSSTPTRPTTTTTNNSHRYYLYKEKNRRYSTVNTTLHLFLFYFSLSLSSSFRVLIWKDWIGVNKQTLIN